MRTRPLAQVFRFLRHPIDFSIVDSQVHTIRHLVSAGRLYVMSAEGVLVVNGLDNVLRADVTLDVRPYSNYGASDVRPVRVEDVILYVATDSQSVRDLSYSFQEDSHKSVDLTILVKHLFNGTRKIVDWAYQRSPDQVVWCVLDDGGMLSLTFVRDQRVFAWARHDTGDGDQFKAVGVVEEADCDCVYFVVDRTIDGTTSMQVERMATREYGHWGKDAIYLDSAIKAIDAAVGPFPVTAFAENPVRLRFAAPHGKAIGDILDLESLLVNPAGTAIEDETVDPLLHERRFTVLDNAPGGVATDITLAHHGTTTPVDGTATGTPPLGTSLTGYPIAHWPKVTHSGFLHLAGSTINVLANGSVIDDVTVSATGTITLDDAASFVVGGRRITSELGLLEPMTSVSTHGREKSTHWAIVNLLESRGGKIRGESEESYHDIKPSDPRQLNSPLQLITGPVRQELVTWKQGRIEIFHDDPLPFACGGVIYRTKVANG